MPAINPTPQSFEIEAASPEAREPENESYIVRIRLQGSYEVRTFLSDNGVDEKRTALAIEELTRSGQVKVNSQPYIGGRLRRVA